MNLHWLSLRSRRGRWTGTVVEPAPSWDRHCRRIGTVAEPAPSLDRRGRRIGTVVESALSSNWHRRRSSLASAVRHQTRDEGAQRCMWTARHVWEGAGSAPAASSPCCWEHLRTESSGTRPNARPSVCLPIPAWFGRCRCRLPAKTVRAARHGLSASEMIGPVDSRPETGGACPLDGHLRHGRTVRECAPWTEGAASVRHRRTVQEPGGCSAEAAGSASTPAETRETRSLSQRPRHPETSVTDVSPDHRVIQRKLTPGLDRYVERVRSVTKRDQSAAIPAPGDRLATAG